MIELCGVTKTFNAGKSNQFTAIDTIDLAIKAKKITVFKGPSGSGKTTLLSLIGCMSRPSSGRIRLHGIRPPFFMPAAEEAGFDVSNLPERFLNLIRRTTFGFIFQHFNLIRGISVAENIMLPAYPSGEDHAMLRTRAHELMQMFDISRHASSRVDLLSGGELQRVAIARALINDPAVLIADEPTAHLDSELSKDFMESAAMFRSQGKTVLIASHDPIVFDSHLADQVFEMRDGRVQAMKNS